jgi:adenylate cyclase
VSWRGSKWPEDGYEDCTQDKDKKIERHAKFEVVGKTVTTRAIYQEVGLIADGRGKTGAGPNSARAHALLANALLLGGRPAEAIQLLEKALRLNPMPGSYVLYVLGAASRDTGQYKEAIAACKKAIKIAPKNQWAHLALTSSYSLSGREEEARTEAEEVLRINPKFSLAHFAKIVLYKNQADKERLVDALRKAGLK